jgi:hypothetical protein
MATMEEGRLRRMKKRHIIFINLLFIGMVLFSAGVVYQFMTGNKPLNILSSFTAPQAKPAASMLACNAKQPVADLTSAKITPLRKLATYQQACHSYVTGTMMVFVSMPTTTEQAVAYAKTDADTLIEFAKYGIRPLVIAEPSDADGNNLDFSTIAGGGYNKALDTYFAQLKIAGLTDQQMGIWNPLPEANLPYWKNNQPHFFAPAVTHYFTALHSHFPKAQTSILLNSATYQVADFNWESGEYNSLSAYVKGIPKGAVNYAGIQGFPWVPRQTNGGAIFNASEFLSPPLLTEMADALGTKNVWFNTGTFGAKYALDPDQKKTITPPQRKEILMTIKDQAITLQKKGYNVAVNIFAQDKSTTSEETDWSYWDDKGPDSSLATSVLVEFIRDISNKNVDFWLFDK